MKKLFTLALTIAASAYFTHPYAHSQNSSKQGVFTSQERKIEERKIRQKIEEKLNWQTRMPETLDDNSDQARLLIGTLNESILLRKATGERFGLFESFNDANNTKVIEIRLHTRNRLTDRFPVESPEMCDEGTDITADNVATGFVVYTTSCMSRKYGKTSTPYLFDYASRNLYQLAVLDYDPIENNAPHIRLENGIYKMRWNVQLRSGKRKILVLRNFKILKGQSGKWTVKELPPIDEEAANVSAIDKAPIKSEYNLPAYVANWTK